MLVAGGFALAVAATPAIATFTAISPAGAAPAACAAGEEADLYTNVCLPHTVPNSTLTGPFHSMPGNPQVPMVGDIPCTPMREVQCIGLAQNDAQVPHPVPHATFGP
jgi:hypothetical protein